MSRFFNPELTESEQARLEDENWVVLAAMQATIGLIGPEVLGIAVRLDDPNVVRLLVAVSVSSDVVREEVDEMADELVDDLDPDFEIARPEIHVGTTDATWPGRSPGCRLIYLANGTRGS